MNETIDVSTSKMCSTLWSGKLKIKVLLENLNTDDIVIKVKVSRNRPGLAQMFTGGLGSQIS
jgi:hypothetical protein